MADTTDPTGGDDSGTISKDNTQIDTKPPQPKPNVVTVFIAGFVAGLLVGAAAMATCGGAMGSRQMASAPVEQRAPVEPPAPTQPPVPR
jgi:hypothetical protein